MQLDRTFIHYSLTSHTRKFSIALSVFDKLQDVDCRENLCVYLTGQAESGSTSADDISDEMISFAIGRRPNFQSTDCHQQRSIIF